MHMKRVLLTYLLLFFQIISFGQPIDGVISRDAFGGERGIECIINAEIPFSRGDILKLLKVDSCKNSFVVLHETSMINVEKKFFYNPDSLTSMLVKDSANLNDYYTVTKALIERKELELKLAAIGREKADLSKFVKIIESKGIAIADFKVFDISDVTEGTGLEFSILNATKKTIKYVFMTVVGYNAVDDPVTDRLKGTRIAVKCVGPLEKDKMGTYSFDYLWFTDMRRL
jgi:hypothetical protein